MGSDGVPKLRGACVAFGDTRPEARAKVLGRPERGTVGEPFKASTGKGYVAPVKGDYDRAQGHGVDVRLMLFSTWGGWSPESVALFAECAEARGNKLRKDEYDVTTWSARTWLSFQVQKVSVALHHAAALEIAHALGLSVAIDARE